MALGDPRGSRCSQSSDVVSNHWIAILRAEEGDSVEYRGDSMENETSVPLNTETTTEILMAYLPRTLVLCEFRHQEFEAPSSSSSEVVSNWRPQGRMRTGYVALVLCLNIGVDPPDVRKISPCARTECWIDPFSITTATVNKTIGNSLLGQYKRWQPKQAHYELQIDPTVGEVKRKCNMCRLNANSDRVLFHYNGHGVPKPTANGEIWVFNKGCTQYIPLSVSDLDSWLKTPSIYVFDCSAAGMIVNALTELQECNLSGPSSSSMKDCILLAACEAHESLPQHAGLPADVFTSCLTTPIKMALSWFCPRSLLRDAFDPTIIDKIPGHPNDRKSLLGELNWIFTAVTDTIAWNVLPHDTFQRLFRQDLLVASLFRNFLLAERIMRSTNCSPISYPLLPQTHWHHMWDAWDMAVETCLKLFVKEPEAEFQPSSFFDEQLTAFEVWLDFGSQHKKPPEQLPIVLWVLLSQSHRFRALFLLGRFLDMGPWAVNLILSVGIFPYVLKLLKTPAADLRQSLVFIWTKILAFDKSCQVDLVKDGGHFYFIKFLDSIDANPEQRAMAAFVLTVIVDGHRQGQEACVNSDLIHLCLRYLQPNDIQTEPLLLQWLCLCLGKLCEDCPEARVIALRADALKLHELLSDPQPEVRASATFALSNLLESGSDSCEDWSEISEEIQDNKKVKDEVSIVQSLLAVVSDGNPLVRLEVAIALARFSFGHKQYLKLAAVTLGKHSNTILGLPPLLANLESSSSGSTGGSCCKPHGLIIPTQIGSLLIGGRYNTAMSHYDRVSSSDPATTGVMSGSPESEYSSHNSDLEIFNDRFSNMALGYLRPKPLDERIYCQCVLALCSLARDPSPHIAGIGKQILTQVGIDQVAFKAIWYGGGNNRLSDIGASLPASSSHARLARSSLGLDLSAGQLPRRLGSTSAIPPQQRHFTGMRRVLSGPHLANSQNLGLADPLLVSGELSSILERNLLSHSAIYKWSCNHFSRPIRNTIDDDEEILSRREEREKVALDCMMKWQRFSVGKLNKQIACWDTNFKLGTKAALLDPFSPVVIVSDETEQIRVWNYKEDIVLNSFDNHNFSNKGVSKLCPMNEFDDSLLLVASRDGNVRIWKDYTSMGDQKLVTAFSSIQSIGPAFQNVGTVVDWQQQSGYLYASGEISSIMLWDMDREQCIKSIPSLSEVGISALSASQVHKGQLAAGFKDGSVRLYDIRTPDMMVGTAQLHIQGTGRVVGLGFQPGLDPLKIVSASDAGDIQFLDLRNRNNPYLSIHPYTSSLTAFVIHRHAPIIASGSANQHIDVFDLDGDQLSSIRYHQTVAERTRHVSCLAFHPYEALLVAGATNAFLSIYDDG
ncbi:regulatory-associated protein of TOR 1-like isoform X1 [Camellia sinensis]|uniref:regulatory-associated protein of TOR 1-like isoform X1 n=1 Tax=Camellia sinensis TaxID=4442 RepID=UPI00103607D1|nr:regulatory-associated protein of TOR 1-like isoform X1 [Camellia sinensis]